jgi:hypothetical protein
LLSLARCSVVLDAAHAATPACWEATISA